MSSWVGRAGSAITALFAIAACGSGDPSHDQFPPDAELRSGARLKLQWHVGENVRAFAAVYDSERRETCAAAEWADGSFYCTPASEGAVVYQDDTCSTALGALPEVFSCQPRSESVTFQQLSLCDARVEKLYRGSLASVSGYYVRIDGACRFVGGEVELYKITEEISPTALVSLSLPAATGAGRLRHRYVNGADGSRLFAGTFDERLGGTCTMIPSSDLRSFQCLARFRTSSAFRGATCDEPAVAAPASCEPEPYALTRGDASCPLDFQLSQAGPRLPDGEPTYIREGALCIDNPVASSNRYYSHGDPVETAMLVRDSTEAGKGRLLPISYTDPTRSISFGRGAFFDTVHQTDCRPLTLPDGTIRCLPDAPTAFDRSPYLYGRAVRFTDTECLRAVQLIELTLPSCASTGAPPAPTFLPASEHCVAFYQAQRLGPLHTGSLYKIADGACVPEDNPSSSFYAEGPVVPLQELARLTLVTEP